VKRVTIIYAYLLVFVRKVFLDPEPPISNVPKLNQKSVVGDTVKSFVEITSQEALLLRQLWTLFRNKSSCCVVECWWRKPNWESARIVLVRMNLF